MEVHVFFLILLAVHLLIELAVRFDAPIAIDELAAGVLRYPQQQR